MEKGDIEHVVSVDTVEHEKAAASTVYTGDHSTNVHHKSPTERKLVLKAQVLITTLAALIYFVAYLVRHLPFSFWLRRRLNPWPNSSNDPLQDRNSIGNARVMGLQKDLKLTPNQYYNVLTMFCTALAVSLPWPHSLTLSQSLDTSSSCCLETFYCATSRRIR